jgi:hypothetical protein
MKTPLLIINTVVAIASGLLVLIGYFIPGLDFISDVLLQWAVILAAFALLIGMVNLVTVHANRLRERKLGSIYSLVLLLSFGAGLLIFGINAPTGAASMWVFQYIQLPVEASLMAVLVVTLAYSSMRLLRRRAGLLPVIFVVTAFLVLLGMAPIYGYGDIPVLSGLRNWIAQVPAMAGARGVLIGVALGTVATGLRILIGADRPYGGG